MHTESNRSLRQLPNVTLIRTASRVSLSSLLVHFNYHNYHGLLQQHSSAILREKALREVDHNSNEYGGVISFIQRLVRYMPQPPDNVSQAGKDRHHVKNTSIVCSGMRAIDSIVCSGMRAIDPIDLCKYLSGVAKAKVTPPLDAERVIASSCSLDWKNRHTYSESHSGQTPNSWMRAISQMLLKLR
jgi:hypothetical protein